MRSPLDQLGLVPDPIEADILRNAKTVSWLSRAAYSNNSRSMVMICDTFATQSFASLTPWQLRVTHDNDVSRVSRFTIWEPCRLGRPRSSSRTGGE